jgi:hypothetical protein
MMTKIRMLAIDLAKGSFQVCAVGPDGACVDKTNSEPHCQPPGANA